MIIERLGKDFGNLITVFEGESVISGEYRSDPIPLSQQGFNGVEYRAYSLTTSPKLRIYYEMCSDVNYMDHFVHPEDAGDIVTLLTDQDRHIKSIQPPPMPYLRIVVEALAGNSSDTKIDFFLFSQ